MKFSTITAVFASASFLTSQHSFACSDRPNGLITKYKGAVKNVAQLRTKLKPNVHVTAHAFVPRWSSPNCGACCRARNPKNNRSFKFVATDVLGDTSAAVIAGADAFKVVSPLGTTGEGTILVYVTPLPDDPSHCFK
ncbi:hypothetical protein BJY01DRAFT_251105 [Aspergillus pseudoustus]|uniref:Uncharacterized protein n=1 Tax=Aspergillus pseudoustus TaxID=1810923 RepID=A0ABR4JDH8_9EURO